LNPDFCVLLRILRANSFQKKPPFPFLCSIKTCKNSMIYIHLLLILIPMLLSLPASAQDSPPEKQRSLEVAGGLTLSAERDRAYSPLLYSGSGLGVMLGYSVEGPKKSEKIWLQYAFGCLKNRFDALSTSRTASIFNYTLYHPQGATAKRLHLGWSNRNMLRWREFMEARNFQPRFDYHTSFGPAGRYTHQFQGKLSRFRFELFGHIQLIGFFLQSSLVSGSPPGYEEENDEGLSAILRSMRFFYPGKAWDLGIWPALHYRLNSGNSLSLSYRYDRTVLEDARRSARSRGFYFLTLNALL
jgi:hypothetical protein